MMQDQDLKELLSIMGKRISERRKTLKLSQEKLAETAGLSRDHVAKIELGIKTPSIGTLLRLARALGMPVSDMLAGEITPPRDEVTEVAYLLGTLTDSEVDFAVNQLRETAQYLKKHRKA